MIILKTHCCFRRILIQVGGYAYCRIWYRGYRGRRLGTLTIWFDFYVFGVERVQKDFGDVLGESGNRYSHIQIRPGITSVPCTGTCTIHAHTHTAHNIVK